MRGVFLVLTLAALAYGATDVVDLGEAVGDSTYTVTFTTQKANRPNMEAKFEIKVSVYPTVLTTLGAS